MTPQTLAVTVGYLVFVNIWAFAQMGIDKHKARAGAWRISEKMLFVPVVLGGGIGGILGMRHFHHKTRHWYFQLGFPLITVAELLLAVLIIWKL